MLTMYSSLMVTDSNVVELTIYSRYHGIY